MAELSEGLLIAKRYRLRRLLGEGGMGAVWSATHEVTRKGVALKFLKPSGAARVDVIKRFLREARAASAVRHPNVVQIHDILQDEEGIPIMVMDLLDGESLAQRLEREHAIPLPDLARIMVPVISALGTAHSLGIVHRDMKPDNVFLAQYGDGRMEPKVLDFGIAKLSSNEGDAAQTSALTKTGSMLGTPYYMSPEQAFGEKDVDQRADVWSMGVMIYECLTGKRPVDGDNFGQLLKVIMTGGIVPLAVAAPSLPADVIQLVDSMLQLNRAARPPSLEPAFHVLSRYTDIRAETFASPVTLQSFDTINTVDRGSQVRVVTGGRDARVNGDTGDVFARTAAVPSPARSRMIAIVAAAGVVGAVGMGALFLVGRSRESTSAQNHRMSDGVIASLDAAAESSASQPTAAASASSAAAASASDRPVVAPVTSVASPRRSQPAGGAKPPPVATDPAPIATPAKRALPGNIPEKAPF